MRRAVLALILAGVLLAVAAFIYSHTQETPLPCTGPYCHMTVTDNLIGNVPA